MITAVEAVVSPVYLVGGSVRDQLLGKTPTDFDFTTPLTPDEIEAQIRAAGRKPYLMGKRFGTVGFRVDGNVVEVTTFRAESYQPRSRKPEVEFVRDIELDLARRDFTINAIARRGDEFIDPFGGRKDLEAKVIRSVGDPYERFREDPLRLLRAARFAAQLGFGVEGPTSTAMVCQAHTILDVARERWMIELDKMLLSPRPSRGLQKLFSVGLLPILLPEFGNIQCAWFAVDWAPFDIMARWAALFSEVSVPQSVLRSQDAAYERQFRSEAVERTALYLKWSNERRNGVKQRVLAD